MTAAPESSAGRKEVAVWSMLSVLLLVVMCAIYVAHGDSDSGPLANPGTLSAVAYTVLLGAPYAFIALVCLRLDVSQTTFEFARALSNAAIIGILIVAVGSGLGFLLFLLMTPNPLVYVGMVMGPIAGQLQGPGLLALLALFMVQFALRYCAKRAIAPTLPDDAATGRLLGYATLFLPVLIYAHINLLHADREQRAVEKSREENNSRERARKTELDKGSQVALDVVRTRLHVCVHAKCADSLIDALKSRRFAIRYMPPSNGHYFLVVGASEYEGPKYVTDETGIVGRLEGGEQFRTVTPGEPYDLVDSVYSALDLIRNCIRDGIMSEWDEYPLHLPKDVGCYLHGDTSVVHMNYARNYRVIYSSPRKKGLKLVKAFSLAMRPVEYGKPYVRSFLMTQDTTYVTTANRPALPSDPGLEGCETNNYQCRTHH